MDFTIRPLSSSSVSYSSLEQSKDSTAPHQLSSSTKAAASTALFSSQNKENFPPYESSYLYAAQLLLPQNQQLSRTITETQLDQLFDGKEDTSQLLVQSLKGKASDYLANFAKHKVKSFLRSPNQFAPSSSHPPVSSLPEIQRKENNKTYRFKPYQSKPVDKAKGTDKRLNTSLAKDNWDEIKCDNTLFSHFKIFKPKKNKKILDSEINSQEEVSKDLRPLDSKTNADQENVTAFTEKTWEEIKCETTFFLDFKIFMPKKK
ncbi:hypothetical protein [Candidatus Protochlamydia phocaeensis]|uniref:hypothetical protein n=1 Tax=Candidatus Protochlamydia phocaeensis TaxID=1414722 RepID=UPI0008382038|nr:hypothetical protein [Candidatus Protochlamydia phocaeensis]